LREILDTAAQGHGSIPLSNVKRLFRSRFHLELSETALGHAKLSELLQDDRLSEVCAVRLQGHGYVVVPLQVPSSTIRLADALLPEDDPGKLKPVVEDELWPSHDPLGTNDVSAWPLSSSLSDCAVRHTFIHATLPSAGASRRASSLPKDIGSGKSDAEWISCSAQQHSKVLQSECMNGRLRTQSDCVVTKVGDGTIPEDMVHLHAWTSKSASDSEDEDDAGTTFYAGGELDGALMDFDGGECPWGPTPDGSFVFADEGEFLETADSNWPKLAPVQLATCLSEKLEFRASPSRTSQCTRSRSVGRPDLKAKLRIDLECEY